MKYIVSEVYYLDNCGSVKWNSLENDFPKLAIFSQNLPF